MGIRLPALAAARDWADLTLKVFSVVAIGTAGVWALFQWRATDSGETAVQIETSAEALPYRTGSCLLVIHVRSKNVGKTPVSAGKRGLLVSIRSLPSNLPSGPVQIDALKFAHEPVNIIAEWSKDGYLIEPGVQNHDQLVEVAPIGAAFVARAELDVGDGTEVDDSRIVRSDCVPNQPEALSALALPPLTKASGARR